MKSKKGSSTTPNMAVAFRTLCQPNVLLHAVRALRDGYPSWQVVKFLSDKHRCGTKEQLEQVVRLAKQALNAAMAMNALPSDEQLPADLIPRID